LIEGHAIPNNPGRVGSDGKLYTSAGIPREQPERPRKHEDEDEKTTERGKRGMGGAAAVVEETGGRPAGRGAIIEEPQYPAGAQPRALPEGPVDVSVPTIDELLELMSRQIMQVITWTQAEGFLDSYRAASPNARGLFHAAVIKLAARADQLRRS
jgi:hypothetical protein